ncbi:hypothetical protein C0J08_11710 [Marinomonas sp. CT5]|uniref:GmrSD restriction endonuclease domain-containing protein n=1 Tax=Marinomonas sp. CT5 TaxID=2066133 RepID=UPI001BAE8C84|nr:DUF262 domain-containing protein [Marinomonas sp. CT5]QUX96032.1 hypothetical protein C0J08_11710 [Marinomonas sp. CT5]
MKRGTEQRTVRSFCRRMRKINLQPTYQRGAVWSKPQKQLLIDSILRDLDVPKIYLREISDDAYEEEAVDGQQRLTAIYGFYNDEFPLSKDADDIDGQAIAGMRFSTLDEDVKDLFEAYELTVVILRNASEEEVEEMFLRLQNGTTLNAAEKRNAMRGNMKDFVRIVAQHDFFDNCGFKNHRFAYDLIASQMIRTALEGEPCGVKSADIVKMYERNENFDSESKEAKKIIKMLDLLLEAFPEKTPELTKLTSLSLFILFSYLKENFDIKNRITELGRWFIDFETWRKADEQRPSDERDPEMVTYQDKMSRTTDSQDSVEYRHRTLLTRVLKEIPDLIPLDPQRIFSHEQRMAIFRRDGGVCQVKIKCDGVKCTWDYWHTDHKVAWSNGGKTTVENGQVACVECNLAKSAN